VRVRDLGKTTSGNPFVAVEIASPATLGDLDRFKRLQRKLYFRGGAPSDAERDEIFRDGKAVVVVSCNIHSTEMARRRWCWSCAPTRHRDSPLVRKVLDRVVLVLVPSLNPDGQIHGDRLVQQERPAPSSRRARCRGSTTRTWATTTTAMYMFTQQESRLTAQLLWHELAPRDLARRAPAGQPGRPHLRDAATDPINPNVHPLIYRWNGILGQAQAAALEGPARRASSTTPPTPTSGRARWRGALVAQPDWPADEVASVRVASPTEQRRATPAPRAARPEDFRGQMRRQMEHRRPLRRRAT